jgi:L-arabinokinase
VRDRLGLPPDAPLALVSFGGYQSHELDLPRAAATVRAARIVVTGPPGTVAPGGVLVVNEDAMYAGGLRYEDLVGAVDLVLTKPGYGIVSECIANDTRLLFTPRGRFREYEVFVAQMPRLLPCEFLSLDDLGAGRWDDAIRRLLDRPAIVPPATNGADLIADRLCGLDLDRL